MPRPSGSGRVPPSNIDMERNLIGAALMSPDALEVLVTETEPEDYYKPVHGSIVFACRSLVQSGLTNIDAALVLDELRPDERDQLNGGAELVSMMAQVPATRNARLYAVAIVEAAMLRRLLGVVGEIQEDAYDPNADATQVIGRARELIGTMDMPIGGGAPPTDDVDIFLSGEEEYDWIVPGLIERSDRTILTAGEGVGKSTLLRQMAMSIASGIHPFQYHPFVMSNGEIPNVMVMDVENSRNQVRRKMLPMRRIAGVERGYLEGHLRIEVRTEGIDLTQRHDARWLQERVAANRPDVLVIGPIYKLYDGDPNKEELVRKVIRVLDLIRTRYRCALLIEAHSPHGESDRHRDLRPLGSSMWRRWPEFGFGMQPDKDDNNAVWFTAWRGPRDEREWPRRLIRSDVWPWGTGRQYGRPVHHDDDSGRYEPEPDDETENF